jgi:hypothetical protein
MPLLKGPVTFNRIALKGQLGRKKRQGQASVISADAYRFKMAPGSHDGIILVLVREED